MIRRHISHAPQTTPCIAFEHGRGKCFILRKTRVPLPPPKKELKPPNEGMALGVGGRAASERPWAEKSRVQFKDEGTRGSRPACKRNKHEMFNRLKDKKRGLHRKSVGPPCNLVRVRFLWNEKTRDTCCPQMSARTRQHRLRLHLSDPTLSVSKM